MGNSRAFNVSTLSNFPIYEKCFKKTRDYTVAGNRWDEIEAYHKKNFSSTKER
jgi:hypothetical protein